MNKLLKEEHGLMIRLGNMYDLSHILISWHLHRTIIYVKSLDPKNQGQEEMGDLRQQHALLHVQILPDLDFISKADTEVAYVWSYFPYSN